jgi:hypothetical protein
MKFRDRLLQKIKIDELTRKVTRSLTGPDSGVHFDKESMRQMMGMGPYPHLQDRDLDFYILEENDVGCDKADCTILVLDNGLPIYRTTMDDVKLRKNPTVKEMVNIRNAIKILNDKDVVVSRKAESLNRVRARLIDALNLSYDAEDIDDIAKAGQSALEQNDCERVEESLRLFAELLQLLPLPHALRKGDQGDVKVGRTIQASSIDYFVELVTVYECSANRLRFLRGPLKSGNRNHMEQLEGVLNGDDTPADAADAAVFDILKETVVAERPIIG